MPLRWFFTESDGTRVGPFAPLVLKQMAIRDELPTSGTERQNDARRTRRIKGRFRVPRGPRADRNP